MGAIYVDSLRIFEPIYGHKTRVNNTVDLHSYLRFCGNIMFSAVSNNNVWLTESSGMNTNICDMLYDSNFALYLDNGGCCGSAWGHNEEWGGDFVVVVILEITFTVFTCLLYRGYERPWFGAIVWSIT